jgi:predicted  nucleic acid-binding Zn-ribbon protein
MDSFSMGTLAGAGCFRCEECGFGVALHEMDEVPECPHCGGRSFKRGSIFGDLAPAEPIAMPAVDPPDWLDEARDALVEAGDYLAFEDDRVRVAALQEGWTRVGRSMSAHVRFDGDQITIGRFDLHYICLTGPTASERRAAAHTGVG